MVAEPLCSTSEWETHWLGDVGYFVRCRPVLVTRCIGMEFEAFEGVVYGGSGDPPDWPADVASEVWLKDYQGTGDWVGVECLDEAHRSVFGRIGWDGEGHLYFGEPRDEGYQYFGGVACARKLGLLLEHVWRIAWEFYLNSGSGSEREFGGKS